MMPTVFEVQSAHEEGGERVFLASTVEFLANEAGELRALRVAETEYVNGHRVPRSGTEREIPADLVLIAMGFTGPDAEAIGGGDRPQTTDRGVYARDDPGRVHRRRRRTAAVAHRLGDRKAVRRPRASTATS